MEGSQVRRVLPSITVCMVLALALFASIDLSFEILPTAEAPTIYVDDDYGFEDADHKITIQAAVDNSSVGGTVFVYNGTYYEDVYINKTINLTGISRDNTTINCSSIGIFVENADYVNISGFTVINGSSAGIRIRDSNNSIVENNRIENNTYGTKIIRTNNTIVRNNIALTNSNYYAIYFDDTTNSTIDNNTCFDSGAGIMIKDKSSYNIIINNNCSNNDKGILLSGSQNNYIADNILYSCPTYGIWDSSNGGNIY
ncbi:MAG: right-handed parallel beta-helix repeat-containing protein, partial [Methanomassiliicoccales archaeon]